MKWECRDCGAVVDAATIVLEIGRLPPAAGDVSVCFYCACISVYTGDGLELLAPSEDELAKMVGDVALQRVVRAVRESRS
jgi:hypothetical protein